jgi:CBS domain-containing membrane protein
VTDTVHKHIPEAPQPIEKNHETFTNFFKTYMRGLPKKLHGGQDVHLPLPPLFELCWSWVGAFLGLLAVSSMNRWLTPEINLPLMVASFGASAVLLFATPESKLSQPRSFLGGHLVSALVGVVLRLVIRVPWICGPLATACALSAMELTRSTHPPGGATALIIASVEELPKWSGFSYVVGVMFGAVVFQGVALVVNNLNPRRAYPTFWW